MIAITREQMRLIDESATRQFGISSRRLMERAGASCARWALLWKPRRAWVFCGKGNNGGDGYVAARHLARAGIPTNVLFFHDSDQMSALAGVCFQALSRGKRIRLIDARSIRREDFRDRISAKDVIVDAFFGIGLNQPVTGLLAGWIRFINSSRAKILSVDIPSGLDANTGRILGVCVRADLTVTFGLRKKGFDEKQGPRRTGRVVVDPINFPRKLLAGLVDPKRDRLRGFPPIADSKSRILVLGSMPGPAALRRSEYYGHPQNGFWPIMAEVFKKEAPDFFNRVQKGEAYYDEKKAFLLKRRIALWDVLESCVREGASDARISKEKANDLPRFLSAHPSIRRIYFNGSKAADAFLAHFGDLGPASKKLPSTSPAYALISRKKKVAAWRAIRGEFFP